MSLRDLIIVGAGNFGREVYSWARDIPEDSRDWNIKGFIDDTAQSLAKYNIESPILSKITDYKPERNDVFICAIADPKGKLKVCSELVDRGAMFTNVIHPTCVIGENNSFGTGIIMCPYSIVTTNVEIGDFVTINIFSSVGHDAIVNDGVTLSAHCDVTGYVELKKGVFLGSGARVLPKAQVQEFARVGAGSVVLKRVKANRTVFGIPAQYID